MSFKSTLTGIREKVCPSACSQTARLYSFPCNFFSEHTKQLQVNGQFMTHFWDQKCKVQTFHNSERERAHASKTARAHVQREYTIMHRLAEPAGERDCNLQPYLLDTASSFVHPTAWCPSDCVRIGIHSGEQGLFYRKRNTAINIQDALNGMSTAAER